MLVAGQGIMLPSQNPTHLHHPLSVLQGSGPSPSAHHTLRKCLLLGPIPYPRQYLLATRASRRSPANLWCVKNSGSMRKHSELGAPSGLLFKACHRVNEPVRRHPPSNFPLRALHGPFHYSCYFWPVSTICHHSLTPPVHIAPTSVEGVHCIQGKK